MNMDRPFGNHMASAALDGNVITFQGLPVCAYVLSHPRDCINYGVCLSHDILPIHVGLRKNLELIVNVIIIVYDIYLLIY